MSGYGTIMDVVGVLIGGILGSIIGNRVHQRYQDTLMVANGASVIFIGISEALSYMLKIDNDTLSTYGTMMLIVSLAIGSLLGEFLDIEGKIEHFGNWLKKKTNNSTDDTFVNGFVSASLTICIGSMAIVGSIQDGLTGNYSILAAKAVIDLFIIFVMTASMGKGCLYSIIPLAVLEGSITALAKLFQPLFTDQVMINLSLTGSILIFCVGVNLIWGKKFKVANMLPSLLISIIWNTIDVSNLFTL